MVAIDANDRTKTEEGYPIPGSVHLVDTNVDVTNDGQKDIILVPQPSNDPEDPLNWSQWRKHVTFAWAFFFVFMASGQGGALSTALLSMEDGMGIPLAELNAGTGYLFLCYGIGCLFTQPLAMAFGRRPVILVSSIVGGIGCQIWLAHCKSVANYHVNRVVTGLVLSPVESLVEIVVTDLYFAHERGHFLSVFIFALHASGFICPMVAGFVNDSLGWEWIPYLFAIIFAFGIVGSFFFLEETMYHREDTESIGGFQKTVGTRTSSESSSSESADETVYPKKTFMQRLALFNPKQCRKNIFLPSVYRPLVILFKFPTVAFGGVIIASSLSWFSVMTATVADVYGNTYGMSNIGLSLMYLGPFVGSIFVFWVGGQCSDWICLKLARRNKGLREPEYRLFVGLTGIILNPLGMWLYGMCAARNVHWVASLFGLSIVGYCINLGAVVPYNYVLDAHKSIGGDAVVSVVLVRNLFGFAFAYCISPWIEAQGLFNTFLVVGILSAVFWAFCVPMIIWGKRLRIRIAKKYYEYCDLNSLD